MARHGRVAERAAKFTLWPERLSCHHVMAMLRTEAGYPHPLDDPHGAGTAASALASRPHPTRPDHQHQFSQ